MNNDAMRQLRTAAPEKVSVLRDGLPVEYTIITRAPSCGLVPSALDAKVQLEQHGFSVNKISLLLSQWLRRWADEVDEVALSYSAVGYLLCVLLPQSSSHQMDRIYASARKLGEVLAPYEPIVHVMGKEHRSPLLFSEAQGCLVGQSRTRGP